ncbi:hypothetical protein [Desulfofundulus thermosubterraneus]|uniref:Uncharacterized protein n=1 Tax=Desulfofundulus thermosubterraneus DSM 16057 TaxID=1121432 RepID=A0A1M6GY37_9FIRM|nr:hypothetical protein [Desulfofundulus thermosubterraneus]SHJ14861.1 hypothetical protein SAMN02745219_01846 [Desulfofundulus thermosubterraneus DSM 16057]
MVVGIILAVPAAVVGFALLRRYRWEKLHEELNQKVITEDKLGELTGSPWYRIIEPAAVAGATAYDVVHALAMMDDRVLEAMDFSSKLDLSTFNRLSAYVHDQFYTGGEASITGAVERLQGYAAEQIVAAHLAAQGHVVEFPDTPNQEGWDLLVDGHPLQVKCVMDPAIIKEHLERYPDIPVIVNAEMGQHFADNSHVIVDKDLIHSQVAEHVHNTIHGVHAIDSIPFHVPVITLALAAVREGVLLADGRVNLSEAARNVGRDVAMVGGGGFIGSKVGLAVGGMVLGPVGAAIGSILGAVAGAVAGRKLANSARLQPLEEAKDKLNRALYEVVRLVPEAIEHKVAALEGKIGSVKRRLKINFLSWLWPSRRCLLFREIKGRIENRIEGLREKAAWAAVVDKAYYDRSQWEHGLYKPGLEVCRWVMEEERFNHPGLISALQKVDTCAKRLKEEANRLGLDGPPLGERIKRGAIRLLGNVIGWFDRLKRG